MPSFPPKKNAAFTIAFPIRDADGDTVTAAAALDSEVSIDGAAFADATNEATEIGTTGIYTLALTAGEMNGDYITVQTKTSTAGAKTAVNVIYTSTRQIDDLAYPATSGRSMVVDAAGLVDANTVKVGPTGSGTAQTAGDIIGDTNDIQARLPAALVSGRIDASVGAMAANVLTASAIATDAITAAKIAADAIGSSELAASAATEIADAVLTVALTESYAADGAAPTLAQAIFAIQQFLQEKSVSSTTLTVKKLDGTSTAMTFTLSDATTPTSITRAT